MEGVYTVNLLTIPLIDTVNKNSKTKTFLYFFFYMSVNKRRLMDIK